MNAEANERTVILLDSVLAMPGLARNLQEGGWTAEECPGLPQAVACLRQRSFAAVLLDGEDLPLQDNPLEEIRRVDPQIAIVVALRSPRWIKDADARVMLPGDLPSVAEILEVAQQRRRAAALVEQFKDENEQLRKKLLGRDRQLTTLGEAAVRLAQAISVPEELYETIVDVFSEISGARRLSLMLVQTNGGKYLKIVKARGLPEQVVAETRQSLGEGVAGWVARYGRPLLRRPPVLADREEAIIRTYRTQSFLCLPLKVGDEVLGVENLTERFGGAPFDESEAEALSLLAGQAAICIQHAQKLELAEQRSRIDELTSLYNRRHFEDALNREIERAQRTGQALALAMLDIDNFKAYNDTHGHQAGDKVLKQIARLMQQNVRLTDVVCRYGGEEFTIILPETGHEGTLLRIRVAEVIERLRNAVSGFAFEGGETPSANRLTLSAGIAIFREEADNAEDLVGVADQMLYEAKEAGRNCVRWRISTAG